MNDDLLTVHEVAARLRVKDYTVRDWLRTGRIQGVKPGGRGWRIRANDLERRLKPGTEENPLEQALKMLDELTPLLSGTGKFSAAELVNTMREKRDKEIASE